MQVVCGQCGRASEVDNSLQGGKIACEFCGREIAVPRLDAEPADDSAGDEEGFAAEVARAMTQKIRIACGSCGRELEVAVRLAGKRAVCPACGKRIRIPHPHEDESTRKD